MCFMGGSPRVSIGLPVHNGLTYIAQAIESILAQTFTDFQLIISDNASTDGTSQVCQRYAEQDPRIVYTRLEQKIGAIENFERAYHLASGEYFKWAAHDDLIAPEFLQRCVEMLDANPDASLAYPQAVFIDNQGRIIKEYDVKLETDSPSRVTRFSAIACAPHKQTHNFEIFGLMRRSMSDQIPQQGAYAASDRVFLARLALHGRFMEVPGRFFLSRDHPAQSIHTLPKYLQQRRTLISRIVGHGQLPAAEWFNPKYTNRLTFPEWRLLWEYGISPRYAPVTIRERFACFGIVARRQMSHWNVVRMFRDFILAGDKGFALYGPDPSGALMKGLVMVAALGIWAWCLSSMDGNSAPAAPQPAQVVHNKPPQRERPMTMGDAPNALSPAVLAH